MTLVALFAVLAALGLLFATALHLTGVDLPGVCFNMPGDGVWSIALWDMEETGGGLRLRPRGHAPVLTAADVTDRPARYVAEMVCDRIAASKNYKGDKYTDAAAWEYYDRSRDHYILHPETRKELETCLLILRDEGEDACFRYIRTELLGRKK